MIPKVIHYCWFGRNPKPALIKKCIWSWRKYCPNYKIIEWNEDNFDVNQNRFCREAYAMKKWAFVSDYVRLRVLYDYGGIYLDTDAELLRPIDILIERGNLIGFQHENYINNGLIYASEVHALFTRDNLSIYENMSFIQSDDSLNMTVCQEYTTSLLRNADIQVPDIGQVQFSKKYQLFVYPSEYFCPIDIRTGQKNMTENTYAIHHFMSSWWDPQRIKNKKRLQRKSTIHRIIHLPNYLLKHCIGEQHYEQLKKKLKGTKEK